MKFIECTVLVDARDSSRKLLNVSDIVDHASFDIPCTHFNELWMTREGKMGRHVSLHA